MLLVFLSQACSPIDILVLAHSVDQTMSTVKTIHLQYPSFFETNSYLDLIEICLTFYFHSILDIFRFFLNFDLSHFLNLVCFLTKVIFLNFTKFQNQIVNLINCFTCFEKSVVDLYSLHYFIKLRLYLQSLSCNLALPY